jgi:hypothetical protein
MSQKRSLELQVESVNNFEWAKQLRYYWETEEDDCFAKQTNTRFRYGYEYLGNGSRLVITPLTDKCYMTSHWSPSSSTMVVLLKDQRVLERLKRQRI